MKKFLLLFLNLMCMQVHGNWILQSINFDPDSSLYVAQAYRLKNGKQKLTYLDKKIKAAIKKPVIMLNYRILTYQNSQDALCIVIRDQKDASIEYELFLDSQSAAAINTDRVKSKKVFDIPAPQDISTFDGSYARAVLKQADSVLTFTQRGYDSEQDSAFELIIHKTKTGFVMQLIIPEA